MLYFLSQFESLLSEFRLFQYITVRTLGAAATGFVVMLLISPSWIHRLRSINFSEQKVDERVGVERKGHKVGTPTMGGDYYYYRYHFFHAVVGDPNQSLCVTDVRYVDCYGSHWFS